MIYRGFSACFESRRSGVRISQRPLLRNSRLLRGFLFFYKSVKVIIPYHCMIFIMLCRIHFCRIQTQFNRLFQPKWREYPVWWGVGCFGHSSKIVVIKTRICINILDIECYCILSLIIYIMIWELWLVILPFKLIILLLVWFIYCLED